MKEIDMSKEWSERTAGLKPSEMHDRWLRWQGSGFPKRHGRVLMDQETEFMPIWPDGFDWRTLGESFMLLVLGEHGTGKTQSVTHLAYLHAMWFGHSVLYTTGMELFDALRQWERKKALLESFRRPRLLVIDEIHLRLDSKYEATMFTELIDHRYREMKSTVMVSNLPQDEARSLIGESSYSRLCETGLVLDFKNDPLR